MEKNPNPQRILAIPLLCCGVVFTIIGMAADIPTFFYMAPGFLLTGLALLVSSRKRRE
ncbi:hypothetical protein HW090_16500 [Pseudomonas sp. ABC1]|uniref:hypothetical protein n=1 Tax=Pseudomonas sp. ABC1 TaxID=2748080 RepID=UPI0015C3FA9B|nr:hypothetical protein [Pseudomonas sp. ABC1]QLF94709.1 hypothetical protein HW090_16500 [Pseudomonas sp. ABC1]